MKNYCILFLFLSTFVFSPCYAARPSSASISYRYISGNKYTVIYKVVRDCRTIPFTASPLNITCDSGSRFVPMTRISIRNVTFNDSTACKPQNQTAGSGSEEHTYEYFLDLDTFANGKFLNCCKFIFSNSNCCRNSSINTMSVGNFYIESMFDRCLASDNSGPTFLNTNIVNLRLNQPNYYNPLVVDTIDNDLLTFELFTPMNMSNSFDQYKTGYSRDYPVTPFCSQTGQKNCQPLPLNRPPRGLYFDTLNGNFIYTPTNNTEVAVLCFKINEYRIINGEKKLIGYYMLENFALNRYVFTNEPLLTKSTMKLQHHIKSGNKLKINFATELNDTMKTDSVRIFMVNPIKGSLDSIFPAWRSNSNFEWTPECKHVRKEPYYFIVNFYTKKKGVVYFQSIAINIFVDPELDLGNDTILCVNIPYILKSDIPGKYEWNSNSNDTSKSYTANGPGKYWLNVKQGNCILTDTINLTEINQKPKVNLGKDSLICNKPKETPITIFSQYQYGVTYQWNVQQNAVDPAISFMGIGTVILKGTNVCGESSDTILIERYNSPNVLFPNDTHLCLPFNYIIKPSGNIPENKWKWNDLSEDSSLTVNKGGLYFAEITNACGVDSDSMFIKASITPSIELGNDTIVCNGKYPMLNASFPESNTVWSTKETTATIQVKDSGKFIATITNYCASVKDSILIRSQYTPKLNLGADFSICTPFTYTLKATFPYSSYVWSDGSSKDTLRVNKGGVYSVLSSNLCGIVRDTITIIENTIPTVDLGRDTSLKKPFTLLLNAGNGNYSYQWNTSINDTLSTLTVSDFGTYIVLKENQCGIASDTILVSDKTSINNTYRIQGKLYPNPALSEITIQLETEIIWVEIYDYSGKMLERISNVSSNLFTIQIESLSVGIYTIRVGGNTGEFVQTFVKE